MAVTVSGRLNHYQLLGVSPTASGDDISGAFRKASSAVRPHAFGSLAELCVAYEVLRDPFKRRSYDASIGIDRKPKLANIAAGARQGLIAQGPVTFARTPQPAEPPKPAIPLGPGNDPNIRPEPRSEVARPLRVPMEEALTVEAQPIDLKRTGILLGTLAVAACTVGGLTGWWSSSAASEAAQTENSVSVPLPRARPVETSADVEPAPVSAPSAPVVRTDRPRPSVAAAPIERVPTTPDFAAAETAPQQDQPDPNPGEQAAFETSAAPTNAASIPLPDAVIARTIHRIGYACGNVASTAPVEGAGPGVFKVTCSSGQVYQAKPVNGRYRFRRWGKA